jgi:hypothetical protein
MGEQSPAFQFYVKEWRSSRAVMRMSFAVRGMYLEMLLEQWEHFSLPDDPIEVAHLLGGTEQEWIDAWPQLRRKFVDRRAQARDEVADVNRKRIINLRLEKVRSELRRYRVVARKGGLARAKAAKRGKDGTYSPAGEPAGTPAATPAIAPAVIQLPSSTASAIATATAKKEEPPSDARGKRPIFAGDRLVVFEWMLDDLMRMLGPHVERFDLHEWFFALDKRAVNSGQVIPQRDGGQWLQAQTLAEAKRRGLPIATAPSGRQDAPARVVPGVAETKAYLESLRAGQ